MQQLILLDEQAQDTSIVFTRFDSGELDVNLAEDFRDGVTLSPSEVIQLRDFLDGIS